MLYKINIIDVICYILASFKFGLWTPWGWHRRAETRRSSERLYACVSHICICLVIWMNILMEMHRINTLRIFVCSLYVTHFELSVSDLFITCATLLSAIDVHHQGHW